MSPYEYDIALSFAGEDRSHAEALAMALVSRKIRVFYDKFEEHTLWGKNLIEYLHEVYSKRARYCIILISKNYVKKEWTRHERRSALERALHQEREYLLPIRLDDTSLPGLPETLGYIRFGDYKIDELADLVVRKLGYPLSRIIPVDTISLTTPPEESELRTVDFDPIQERRFLRHKNLTAKLLPLKNEYGYFALHSFTFPAIDISDERLRNTFLDMHRTYSGALYYASSPNVHPDGYTRRYEIHKASGEPVITEATTCYFDGHIVTEGYLDLFCEGKDGFNPNWFVYKIQRHLQLTKEVFEGFATTATCVVIFQNIAKFKWDIYRYNQVWERKPYAGYHKNIILPVQLSAIHGRDQWNIKINVAENIMVKVARMFGMDRLPQRYWNDAGELDFPRGMPTR